MKMLEASLAGSPPLVRHAPPELMIVAAPAAGGGLTQAVNDGYWWRVLAIACRLTTDANAGNRLLRVEYRGTDAIPFLVAGGATTYPANTTAQDFSLSVWQPQNGPATGAADLAPLPAVIIQPGWDFRVTIANVQAGDTLTRVRFLIERFEAPSDDYYPSD